MAIPSSYDPQEPRDEAQQLALAESYLNLSKSAAWKDLSEMLMALVADAQQSHFSSRETDAFKIIEEKLRWQQRLLVQEAINQKIQSNLELREQILEERKQQGESDEHSTE